MVQDMPPQGGYPSIRYARHLPHVRLSAAAVGVGMTLVSVWGMFNVASLWRERRELKREKLVARLHLLPLLQAEWDREWIRWRNEQLALESAIMKDVDGWIPGKSSLHNDRFAPPKFDLDGNPVRPPVIRWVDTGEPL